MRASILLFGAFICILNALIVDGARPRVIILLSDASKRRYILEPEPSASNIQPVPFQPPERYQVTRRSYATYSSKQQDPDDYYQPNEYNQPIPKRVYQSQLDNADDLPQYDVISTKDSARDDYYRDTDIGQEQRYSTPLGKRTSVTQQEYYPSAGSGQNRKPATSNSEYAPVGSNLRKSSERRQPNPHPDYYNPNTASRKPVSVQDLYVTTPSRRTAQNEQYLKEVEPVTKTTYVSRARASYQQYIDNQENDPPVKSSRGKNIVYQHLQQQQQQQQQLESQDLEPVQKHSYVHTIRGKQVSLQSSLEGQEESLPAVKSSFVPRGKKPNYNAVQVIDNQEDILDEEEPIKQAAPEVSTPRQTQRTPKSRQRQKPANQQKFSQVVEYPSAQDSSDEYGPQQFVYAKQPEAAIQRQQQQQQQQQSSGPLLRTIYANQQYVKVQPASSKVPQTFPSRSAIYVTQTSTNGHKKSRGQLQQPSPEENAPVVKIPAAMRRVRPLSQEELQNLIQSGAYKATLITEYDDEEPLQQSSPKSSSRDKVTYLIRQRSQ